MFSSAKNTRATVIPCLRYSDAPAAIEWLCRAFGFEKHLVVPGDRGTIAHAQLSFGNGMIMLGSALDTDFGRLMKQPKEAGGRRNAMPLCCCRRRGRALCARQGCRCPDRDGYQGRRLRWPGLFVPRSRRPSLELRHL